MAPSNRLPPHAVRVPTYAELQQYVHAFAAGHLNLLMIFGPPGVGKSRCVRHAPCRQAASPSAMARCALKRIEIRSETQRAGRGFRTHIPDLLGAMVSNGHFEASGGSSRKIDAFVHYPFVPCIWSIKTEMGWNAPSLG
jgi:hypothetical protein